ncbi:MAG: 50S ribosomal protein L29 [Patescibacteria group bacterium]
MKASELHGQSRKELEMLLAAKRRRIAELAVLGQQRKIKNVRERSRVRKDVARVLTALTAMAPARDR